MYVCLYVDYFATNKYTTIKVSIKFITVKLITYAIVKTQNIYNLNGWNSVHISGILVFLIANVQMSKESEMQES